MRRFIFIWIFLFPVPSLADSVGHCSVSIHGVYPDAYGACLSFTGGLGCNTYSGPGSEGYEFDNRQWGQFSDGDFFNPNSLCKYDIPGMTVHVFLRVLSCPPGSQPVAELGGACICDQGEMNYETQRCEDPKCQTPTTFNGATGLCEKECPVDKPWSDSARDCVAPPEPCDCSNIVGNPINFFSGHKLQKEPVFAASGDFPLSFSWLYNSFGNHRKTGAGYSVGSKILAGGGIGPVGETMLHTEPPIEGGGIRIRLPLDTGTTGGYTGNSPQHWRHNHSYFLAHYTMADEVTERLIAYRPNGSDLHFVNESGVFVAVANRDWVASKELDGNQELVGWTLKVGDRIEKYDTDGRILRMENEQGKGISYTYDGSGIQQESIANDNGSSITMGYTDGKLTQITRNDSSVYQFGYNENGLLQSITFPGSESPQRVFRYEDSRFPNALTGVTDEAGKVYSTFAYDDQGRAIRTEHNGGTELVDVEYVDANTRRLTNALGKQATYHYTSVDGAKRIASISGETSANCAAANRGYTYDSNGFVTSETDWEGNITTYTRDDLGRELTRTEASGTPEARTITTEWHTEFNVPARVTTSESVTVYSYDGSGRLKGQKVTPVSSP